MAGSFVLVINAGSSSVKFELISADHEMVALKGSVDAIGLPAASITYEYASRRFHKQLSVPTHRRAMSEVIDVIEEHYAVGSIRAVGHRVVQGGREYIKPTIITPQVIRAIDSLSALAPLHNPHNLEGIRACQQILPGVAHVAVFDTAFHQTMEPQQYLYAIPLSYHERLGIRKYGFHGISHSFVAQQAQRMLKRKGARIISCHLGNGCSVTALRAGKSVDTSMGFSPLQGLIMGTRCGDIDAELVVHLQKNAGMSADHVMQMLNKESGLKGICGDADMRAVLERAANGDKSAQLALEMFVQRLVFYIGGYAAKLGGVDAIVFTGGIGERAVLVRSMVCSHLGHLGVRLDSSRNKKAKGGAQEFISSASSKCKVLVIPAHEEMVIARETLRLVR